MGVVHGLESDAGVIAVEVAVLDQVLDGVDDLHCMLGGDAFLADGSHLTFLRSCACSNLASSTGRVSAFVSPSIATVAFSHFSLM